VATSSDFLFVTSLRLKLTLSSFHRERLGKKTSEINTSLLASTIPAKHKHTAKIRGCENVLQLRALASQPRIPPSRVMMFARLATSVTPTHNNGNFHVITDVLLLASLST
jgi:hypothetical protein